MLLESVLHVMYSRCSEMMRLVLCLDGGPRAVDFSLDTRQEGTGLGPQGFNVFKKIRMKKLCVTHLKMNDRFDDDVV